MFKYVLSDADVKNLVDPVELADYIKDVIVEGALVAPRVSLEYEGSWYASMMAAGDGIFTTKLVGGYPENARKGLPLVRALILIIGSKDGEPLILMDGTVATALRTAAASIVAMRAMGAPRGGVYGIIGAGVQGTYHAFAIQRVFNPSRILVYSRTLARAEALASRLDNGVAVDLDTLLRESEVVVAATTSREPVVKGQLLRKDAIVVSVGAPKPVRELDDAVAQRGRCLLVDTREGVERESEDWAGFRDMVELQELLRGKRQCKWGEIRVYKSVGTPLFDHAIALYVTYKVVKSRGGAEFAGGRGSPQEIWLR